MRSALLFGASGQIGRALGERLCRSGWRVLAVSRCVQADEQALTWLQADLAGEGRWPERVDAIFSCGPLDLFSLWLAAHPEVESPRIVAFGSTSADVKHDSPDAAERKLATLLRDSESRLWETAAARGAQATVLRPTLVYGAGRDKTLTSIARIASRTGWFVLPTGATGLRQPVHVGDLAQAAQAVVEVSVTGGSTYALPGGEAVAYREMVRRTLACLQPPARLLEVPAPLFKIALAAARMSGRLTAASDAVLGRMGQDLVFDRGPAARDFGYAPRPFDPDPGAFG